MLVTHPGASSLPLLSRLRTPRSRKLPSFQRARFIGAWIGGGSGLLVLCIYAFGFHSPSPWLAGLPTTHPHTALCLILLALGISPAPWRCAQWTMLTNVALTLLLGFLIVRLSIPSISLQWFDAFAPFGAEVMERVANEQQSAMPGNVATALLMLSFGEVLKRQRRCAASQFFACCTLSLLFIGLMCHLGRLSGFWGAIGPMTFLAVGALAVALLLGTSRHGFMRAFTADSEAGQVARTLLGSASVMVLLIGWVVSRKIDSPGIPLPADGPLLVYQIMAIMALTWIVIAVGTSRADRLDRQRRVTERLLYRTSTNDSLTGLLTRNSIAQARALRAPEGLPSANLLIDLDRFRTVNEALGSVEGDHVLKEVARRLLKVTDRGLVARLGGDEFAIFVDSLTLLEAEQLSLTVMQSLTQPFDINGRQLRLTASVGIAHTDNAGLTDLRQASDAAMYVAKSRGGNQAVVFAAAMHDARRLEAELEQDLREALLREGELTMAYQPVVRASDRKVLALEALARWNHPRLGMVPPDRFIALAEKTGLIFPLGLKLMEIAIAQAAVWDAASPGLCPVLNINVSPNQFDIGDVVADIAALVRRHGLAANRFCIEVTESAFATPAATQALVAARAHGFAVSMDDFGVGYSALSQLSKLPLTSVKLDRSFVVNASSSVGEGLVFLAMAQLINALGLVVVAEGVEDQTQFDLIARSGCTAVQGYFIARPLQASAVQAWLRTAGAGSLAVNGLLANDPALGALHA
ncbi:bifunctional diguanylate cyclase/phosphodiesterase [Acidovorax sp. CCYZU-2555]|uniref:putative bifunctional diguanylate cyclase/phosphodiesterase n=1 Tax=Acidovorax sp. CCYZU-2555 TaxID=2835042 RepID=UPI001BCACB35|nr:bifunctional diguanylate cyclase/phosphodiesterase [Acidovorax sp. CCYZU-2555]MBS7780304.1 bifunctional diguanylate cyclase/phosphodiesterase [Acidovorax sp. CCYZU-2555]